MTASAWVGSSVTNLTSATATSVTVDPSTVTVGAAIATGDFMLLTLFDSGAVPTSPSGWTDVVPPKTQGTRSGGFWYRIRQSGDTSYTFTIPSANGAQATLSWFRGFDPALTGLVLGALFFRTVSQATTPIAGVTSTVNGSLIITASVEATTTTEAGITSATFGTQRLFAPQTTSPQIHTTYINTFDQSTAGASGTNTITYPNAAANGFGVQLALPPAPQTVYDVSGTVAATSAASGTVTGLVAASGTTAATSSTTGTATARLGASGTVAGTSSTTGAVTSRQGVTGTTAATSDASGAANLLVAASGTVVSVTGTAGTVALLGSVAGVVDGTTDTTGVVSLLASTDGVVEVTSGTNGAVDVITGAPIGPLLSVTVTATVPSRALIASVPTRVLHASGPTRTLTFVEAP